MSGHVNIKRKEEKIAPCSEGSSRRSCNARQLFASVVNLYSRQIEWGSGRTGEEIVGVSSLDATLFIGVLPRRALYFCVSTAAPLDRHPTTSTLS